MMQLTNNLSICADIARDQLAFDACRSCSMESSRGCRYPRFFYTIFLRNQRQMQCLFLLNYTYSQGRSRRRHRASIENSVLPGRNAIISFQLSPFRQPRERMESSQLEYLWKPPTLSSNLIELYMLSCHRVRACASVHPISLPRRLQLVIPSCSTSESRRSSSAFPHAKPSSSCISSLESLLTPSCPSSPSSTSTRFSRSPRVPSRKLRSLWKRLRVLLGAGAAER